MAPKVYTISSAADPERVKINPVGLKISDLLPRAYLEFDLIPIITPGKS